MSSDDFQDPPSTVQAAAHEVTIDEPLAVEVVHDGRVHPPVPLERGTYLVGKQSNCALVLTDPEVSRLHLEIRVEGHGVLVRDLGSKNGSYYRGARIAEVLLGAGAVITLGSTRLRLVRPNDVSGPPPAEVTRFGRLLGGSLPMRRLYAVLARIAESEASVLIEGETGTGKELCAEALWKAGSRTQRPFVVCDLSGISRSVIESELFGHKRGSFTGAVSDRIGSFDTANGGTIFLDEIGELELELQPRLLRALENRSIQPVGANRPHPIDVRVICATNRDLAREVSQGTFRRDLYHRLSVLRVRLPPLRERKDDIPALVEDMLSGTGVRASPEALALLAEHDWPGNVRELRNVIDRGVALRRAGQELDPAALGVEEQDGATSATRRSEAASDDYHEAKQQLVDRWERQYLERLLASTEGNMTEAAKRCGLGRAHLYRLMRKYDKAPT